VGVRGSEQIPIRVKEALAQTAYHTVSQACGLLTANNSSTKTLAQTAYHAVRKAFLLSRRATKPGANNLGD
jgi:hypothetical protein